MPFFINVGQCFPKNPLMHKWLPVNPKWPAQELFDKIIDCCDTTKNLFKMLNSKTKNAMGGSRGRVGNGG